MGCPSFKHCEMYDVVDENLQNILECLYLPKQANKKDFAWSLVPESNGMCVVVTGGAGFVGSHLVDRLMIKGCRVIVIDNLCSGSESNVEHWQGHSNFTLIKCDVEEAIVIEEKVHEIYHLACPASPKLYQKDPIKTITTCVNGTMNVLKFAATHACKVLFASTSGIFYLIGRSLW